MRQALLHEESDAWRSQNPTASLPSTTRQAMHDRLSETYTNANTRTELINRIIAVYEARRSGGYTVLVRVAESNWGIGWSNPIGQRPWERTVGSREFDVAGLIGSTYRVLGFE